MKKCVVYCVMVVVIAGITACSKAPQEPPKTAAPPTTPTVPVVTPPVAATPITPTVPVVTHPVAAAPASSTAAAVQAPVGGLAGTTWKLGDLTVTFKDASNLVAKGGPVAAIAPNGMEATYSIKDTLLEITVPTMGITKTGTFDGTKLVIDGQTAVRQQ
jgi:hypothetical protein